MPRKHRNGASESCFGTRAPADRLRHLASRRAPETLPADGLDELPFDQYQRYRLVADLVRRIAGGERRSILDLGGRTGLLRRFLPEHAVQLVDLEPSSESGLVLGDGSRLPFRDRAFDVVVACDTLEHVPAERRDPLIAEAARVSRGHVILAGPFATARVAEAEENLRVFLRAKLGVAHRYLDEHRDRGLPDLAATARTFDALGARTARIGHGNLERWLALMCLSLYVDHDPGLRAIAGRFHRFYNRALYASDREGPFYRHALVAALPGNELPDLEGLFAAPRALSAGLEPYAGFVAELAAFDRERDVHAVERERVASVVAGLVCDLDGHRALVARLEGELGEHRRVGCDLERDLDGHRRALAETRQRLAEHAHALAAVETDLAGHRGHCANLERSRAELDAARLAALAERDEARLANAALREEVASLARRSLVADGELSAHRAQAARRAALERSRWGLLAQVFRRPARTT